MTKIKSIYVCQSCGFQSPQWVGQCPECNEWNTLVETLPAKAPGNASRKVRAGVKPINLSNVRVGEIKRISSNISEFDRVLGGGFVPGQVILLAGEPGIGKSTLLTQISKELKNKKILYVCGEESVAQIKVRAERMNYGAENLLVLAEIDAETISSVISGESGLSLIIIDSIQTITTEGLSGFAGSVGQVRSAAQMLTNSAKNSSTPMILVGHVTKEGAVAGPKVLEHIVDTVLYLEGDPQHMFRVLKTTKNRFGPVSEVGIFEMTEKGMVEVLNPSDLFLSERLEKSPGSCVTVVMEGFRPILFEIQALTTRTTFGYPRRTTSGFPVNRLQLLIAILGERCGINLSDQDVFVNVAGGFKVSEYASDLAVCLAIASSALKKPISPKIAAFGECGLSGEVRRVSHQDRRAKEAKKLGYTDIINPGTVKTVKEAVNRLRKGSGSLPADHQAKKSNK